VTDGGNLRRDEQDRIGALDAACEREAVATERMPHEKQRKLPCRAAGFRGGQRSAHVEHRPIAHRCGLVAHVAASRSADAAIVVCERRVAALGEPSRERAVVAAGYTGGRVDHCDGACAAVGRFGPTRREAAAVGGD
jgi:hypothetical protein